MFQPSATVGELDYQVTSDFPTIPNWLFETILNIVLFFKSYKTHQIEAYKQQNYPEMHKIRHI